MSAARDGSQIVVPDVQAETYLIRLEELARELGSERARDDAAALAQRTSEGRFYVACIGQFKRGKSTLLNAILDDCVLPTGVLPVTAVPTVVRYGPSRCARVRFQGGNWVDVPPENLDLYVSEEQNPENKKGVAGVEVFSPSPLLAEGMCFVDTPGLGSVFAGNTAAIHSFVPHIDAALVVVGADPPISGDEVALVEEVGKQVPDFLIVMNKADKTSEEERRIAKSFTSKVLEEHLPRPVGNIFEISAEERLANRRSERDWSQLIAALQKLVQKSGRDLVHAAAQRGFQRLSEELLTIISEERGALARPIQESGERIRALRQTISDAERSLRDAGFLFMSELHRLSDMFLDQRKRFLAAAMPQADKEYAAQLRRLPRNFGPKFRRDAMRAAQLIARKHVLPWLRSQQVLAEEEYQKVEARFAEIGNGFLRKLSESGVTGLARMPHALDSAKSFRIQSRFTFEDLITVARPPSPLRFLADAILGAGRAFFILERDATDFLGHLMDTNSARVQSYVVNRVQESGDQLEVEIRKLLHEVTRMAQHALECARSTKAEGSAAVTAALARLDAIEQALRSLNGPAGQDTELR